MSRTDRTAIIALVVLASLIAVGTIWAAFNQPPKSKAAPDYCEQAWQNGGKDGIYGMPRTHNAYVQACRKDTNDFVRNQP